MYVYVCSYILFLLSLPPSSHILPLGCGLAQAGLPLPHGSVPLVGCFTHGGACMSVLLSQPIPPSPSPAVAGCQAGSLCHTAAAHWSPVSHMVVRVCQCCFLSPSHPLLPPLWPGARLAPCATRQRPTSWLFCTWWCMYVSAAFSAHPPSPSPTVAGCQAGSLYHTAAAH